MTTLEKFIGRRLEEISAQGPRVKLLKKTSDAAADEVRAKISVTLEGEKRARWRIQVENLTEDAIEWVEFPKILLPKAVGERKASFYWPYNEGVQIDDIDLREQTWLRHRDPVFPGEGSYALFPGMVESQFVAYELDGGLYLGAHDPKRGLKNIDIVTEGDQVYLKLRIYTGATFGEDYQTDFDIVTEVFSGGWMAAAEIYRRWLAKNLPKGMLPIGENPSLPEWYGDSPIVVTYPVRGLHDMDEMTPNRMFPYENALPILDELAEKMNCRLLVLLMHWEGTAPWAPPFVWPPFGGEEMLRAFIDKLHDRGHLLGVYLSGIGWTMQSNLIEEYNAEARFREGGFARSVCLSPDGELVDSKICTGQRRGYDLCPMGADTRGIVEGEVRSMAAAGIDYAQILDQNHGGNPYFCYSRDHGHAPTPGPWMTQSMCALLEHVHAAVPEMLFGCESAAGEPYIPRLLLSDNRFNLGWAYGKPIPMFAYLYHPYVNNFMGNQVCVSGMFKPDRESLLYRLAYSFSAGDLPTLVLTDDGRIMQAWGDRQFEVLPDREQVCKLVRSMAALRRGEGKKYLLDGAMIPPHPLEGAGVRRFEMSGALKFIDADRVLTSRWRALDGSEGQLLVNWTGEDVSCRVDGVEVCVPALSAMML